MTKSKTQKRPKRPAATTASTEPDSTYILKLVLFLIMGALWVRVVTAGGTQVPLPVGALLGLAFAMHEKFQIDRKIEYAVLLVSMFIGFWLPIGFEIIL